MLLEYKELFTAEKILHAELLFFRRTLIDGSLAEGQMSRLVSRARSFVDDIETDSFVCDRSRYVFPMGFHCKHREKSHDEF